MLSGSQLVIDGAVIRDMSWERNDINMGVNQGIALDIQNAAVEMKSGSIEDITLISRGTSASSITYSPVSIRSNSTFTMSGGTIRNNRVGDTNSNAGNSTMFVSASNVYMEGGSIVNNQASRGSAFYYESPGTAVVSEIELSGGKISGNTTPVAGKAAVGAASPIHVAGKYFKIKGSGCMIEDPVYLSSTDNIITISGNLYQTSRNYQVYLNQGGAGTQFKKGSTVVQPDNDYVLDVTAYLINFDLHSNPYILDRGQSATRTVGTLAGIKENQCLVLMQAVYIDSEHGQDSNDGTTPAKAVATFEKAKSIGIGSASDTYQDYFVIYISGPVYNIEGDRWQLNDTAYMCRYTGFEVYEPDGTSTPETESAYTGYLISTKGDLTLNDVRIQGRRSIDDNTYNGDSIIYVNPHHTVRMGENVSLSRNYNIGNYYEPGSGLPMTLSMKGGAVSVAAGGSLEMDGGSITDTDATFGSAIYLDASDVPGARDLGRLKLDNQPMIPGNIYLNGRDGQAEAYVEVTQNYQPPEQDRQRGTLWLRLANDHSGRALVKYPAGVTPTADQIACYRLDDSIKSIYDVVRNKRDSSILELDLRHLLYLDGQNGSDGNSGTNPEQALGSLKEVYKRIKENGASAGALVFVSGQVDIAGGENIQLENKAFKQNGNTYYEGTYSDGTETIITNAQVYFKRYSKPEAAVSSGYGKETFTGAMFNVEAGSTFTANGIYFDGHAKESLSNLDYLTAAGVKAEGPIVRIQPDGKLYARITQTLSDAGTNKVGMSTTTQFANNINTDRKDKELGADNNGNTVREGSSAGIEILSENSRLGYAFLEGVEFRELSLDGDETLGGTDVYNNGTMWIQRQTVFTGSVFLEGLGSEVDPASSRFLNMGEYGTPIKNNFKVIVRDPYGSRMVAAYPVSQDGTQDNDLGFYMLDDTANKFYMLKKRQGQKYILELAVPEAVYVSGTSGSDSNSGWRPNAPVSTLKKAYEKLKEGGGRIIYVVGTVRIDSSVSLTKAGFHSAAGNVTLGSNVDRVEIRRYVKPAAGMPGALYDSDYDVPTFEGTMIQVMGTGSFSITDKHIVDGHYNPKDYEGYPDGMRVQGNTESAAPIFQVNKGALLSLGTDVEIVDNHNTKILAKGQERTEGGAINNSGSVELNGAVLTGNAAPIGAGAFQNGSFTILSNPSGLNGQSVYLTTENSGTADAPVWGTDHTLNTAVQLDRDLILPLDMDHAAPGRDVVRYTAHTGVDAETPHYQLGSTVPEELFLVEAPDDESVLELQNWKVLDVTVPEEIFLVVQKARGGQVSAADGASKVSQDLTIPDYTIKNNGLYEAKVSLSGFENRNAEAGITHDVMNLVGSPTQAVGAADLYLAIKGLSVQGADSFSALTETALSDYGTEGAVTVRMGTMEPGTEGHFTFIASASEDFITHYMDPEFPLTVAEPNASGRSSHFRTRNEETGETTANYARAKYKMSYRVEIVPDRR